MAKFVLGGESFDLEKEDFISAVAGVPPSPIRKYAIRAHGKKYPIKQVVSRATKLEVARFTAHDAYRVLRKVDIDIIVEEL